MFDTFLVDTGMPFFSAFLLGLMTIISPCPFCSNLTAIGFISKDMTSKRLVMLNGVLYAVGKIVAYLALSLVFIFGAQMGTIRAFFEHWGEPLLGPFLILCGLFMLIGGAHETHHESEHNHGLQQKAAAIGGRGGNVPSWLWSFVLGIVFSLAFCPYSGVMYFGMLMPLTMAEPIAWSWLMPVLFGVGTGIPVVIIAWLLSYSVVAVGKINQRIHHFELWLRRICAMLFIGIGMWLAVSILLGHHHEHTELTYWSSVYNMI